MTQLYNFFDLDGTIVNTAPDLMVLQSWMKNLVMRKKLSDIKSFIGKGMGHAKIFKEEIKDERIKKETPKSF